MSAKGPTSLLPVGDIVDRESPLPVFVPGELLTREFLENLLERDVRIEPAHLAGYEAVELPESGWVLLVEAAASSVDGNLLVGAGVEDIRRIDAYQGVGEGLYRRDRVTVDVPGAAEPVAAYAYLPTERTLRRIGRI